MATVTVRSRENLQQEVITSTYRFIADEPQEAGGDGKGPDPYELILSALGA